MGLVYLTYYLPTLMVDLCGFHLGKYTFRPMAWYGRYRTFTLSTPPGRLPPGSSGRGQNQPSIIGGRRGGCYGDGFSCRKIRWKKHHLFSCPGALNY